MFVIATVGQKSWPADKVKELLASKVKILRYNASRVNMDELSRRVLIAQALINEQGLDVSIMVDLTGGKLRFGEIKGFAVSVKAGQQFLFKSASSTNDVTEFVPVDVPEIGGLVQPGDVFTTADGELALRVDALINENAFYCTTLNEGYLVSTRGVNIIGQAPRLAEFRNVMYQQIKQVARLRPEIIALSFVESASYVREVREFIDVLDREWNPKVASKIETEAGVENVEDIATVSDMVIIARGDLALTAPFERLGLFQKKVLKACRRLGKDVVVATQIFGESSEYYIPYRSGLLEVTNLVMEHVSGIMFGSETSQSENPGRPVQIVHKIVETVEAAMLAESFD